MNSGPGLRYSSPKVKSSSSIFCLVILGQLYNFIIYIITRSKIFFFGKNIEMQVFFFLVETNVNVNALCVSLICSFCYTCPVQL